MKNRPEITKDLLKGVGKVRVSIMLDEDIREKAKELAKEKNIGYQTLINHLLRKILLENQNSETNKNDLEKRVEKLEQTLLKLAD
jgi:uncharacterized protein (DUF4415 family)